MRPRLTLYVKTDCAFSKIALDEVERLGLEPQIKNVADEGVTEELVARGGKKQEPYLVDEETGIAMYEANLIARYLRDHYGDAAAAEKEEAPAEPAPPTCDV